MNTISENSHMTSQKKFIKHLSKPLSNKNFDLFFKYNIYCIQIQISQFQANERSLLGGIYKSFTYTKTRFQNFYVLYFAQKIDTEQVQMYPVKEKRKQENETENPGDLRARMTESRALSV